jgi:hypothetical protein
MLSSGRKSLTTHSSGTLPRSVRLIQALGIMDTTSQRRCWAADVGGCSEKISREHLISRSLLPGHTILVEGFDWCKEPKAIGIEALTRKILCTRHNSNLSSADEAIAQLNNLANQPKLGVSISGRALERWFLKTLVNVSIGTEDHIGQQMEGSKPGWPAPYLAAVAFGSVALTHGMGLYFLQCAESYKYRQGEILLVPLTSDHRIAGALFGIAGVYFFFSLNPGAIPITIGLMAPRATLPSYIRDAQMVHRPIWLEFAHKSGDTARVDIDWSSA